MAGSVVDGECRGVKGAGAASGEGGGAADGEVDRAGPGEAVRGGGDGAGRVRVLGEPEGDPSDRLRIGFAADDGGAVGAVGFDDPGVGEGVCGGEGGDETGRVLEERAVVVIGGGGQDDGSGEAVGAGPLDFGLDRLQVGAAALEGVTGWGVEREAAAEEGGCAEACI